MHEKRRTLKFFTFTHSSPLLEVMFNIRVSEVREFFIGACILIHVKTTNTPLMEQKDGSIRSMLDLSTKQSFVLSLVLY